MDFSLEGRIYVKKTKRNLTIEICCKLYKFGGK